MVTPINSQQQLPQAEHSEKRAYNLKRKILDREYNGEYQKVKQKMIETYSKYSVGSNGSGGSNGTTTIELNGSGDLNQSMVYSPIGKKKAAVAAAAAAAAAAATVAAVPVGNGSGGGSSSMSEAASKLMSQMFNFQGSPMAAQHPIPSPADILKAAAGGSTFEQISAAAIARAALVANFNLDDNLGSFNAGAAAVADMHRQGESPAASDDYYDVSATDFAYNANNFFRAAAAANSTSNGMECYLKMNENSNNGSTSTTESKKPRGRPAKNGKTLGDETGHNLRANLLFPPYSPE